MNVSTVNVVFVVEFLTSVNLTENATLTTAIGDPLSGTTYSFEQLFSIIPSGTGHLYQSAVHVLTYNIITLYSKLIQILAPA